MAAQSRLHKSLLNAKVGLIFYFLTLMLSFFSRKIFLEALGDDFIGLAGTLQNILSFLNLAELGIGVCIGFFLFKPIQQDDKESIMEILSVFGYLYRKVGIIIGMGGILVSLFFPLIFRHASLSLGLIYFSFFSFLGSSLIGYFINYRQILLTADQKNYVVAAYFQTAGILKTAVQIALAYYYRNLYVWVSVEFVFGIVSCLILNYKINKEYPWLRTNTSQGKILLKKYPDILLKTKQVFVHRMKDFLLNKSDEILIFAFVSLKMVAYYGNYMLIVNKVIYLVNIVSDGMGAGVGNLVAEGNDKNTMKVFWELTALRFWVVGIVINSFLLFMQPFIVCWLGKEYLLNDWILYLLLFNLFIMFSRGVVEMYIHSYGLYADTWVAWVEVIINIIVTLIAATYWGIIGILLGKILSTIGIALLWRPYYLFKEGVKLSFNEYWKGMIPYYSIFLLFIFISVFLKVYVVDIYAYNWGGLIISGSIIMGGLVLASFFMLYLFTSGMKSFVVRIPFLSNLLNAK